MTDEEKAANEAKAAADKLAADKAAEKKAALEALPVSELVKMISTLNYENAGHRIAGDKAATEATEAAVAQKLIDDKAAIENGEFKTLYEKLKAEQEGSAGKVTAMEATLEKMLETEITAIPETQRVILDQFGTVLAKLDFIATAKATKLFETPGGPGVREPVEHQDGSMTRQEFDKLDPTAKAKHVSGGGKIHD